MTPKTQLKNKRIPINNIQYPSNRNSKKRDIINGGQKPINKTSEEKFPELKIWVFILKCPLSIWHISTIFQKTEHKEKISDLLERKSREGGYQIRNIRN